MLRDNFYDFLS